MHAPNSSALTLLALAPLIVWRICARFRRIIGRQHLSPRRTWITLLIYSVLVLLIAASALAHGQHLGWLGASLLLGAALSMVGLRLTKFEAVRGVGLFYTPNAWIGLALSTLLLVRIGYRMLELSGLQAGLSGGSSSEFVASPATLLAFGLLAGYYLGYAAGLVCWRRAALQAGRRRESADEQGAG